ncbi:M48 family metallopeptidase [Ferrovum sp. PN-J185]|uniref:M48 family metallopeptidase n=1 Tax=Ferrovum sp. PN-J185 TaxID=1356306 RepID=UPI000794B388|nr:M48 family metallopeptidase [Ferrovum sp. PN-J185]KXW55749.1 protease HtpX [Ferrovum sp. PN-J185]MCC6068553.1 M48 family metallopeptidase [Ferrovum sp. PN-J185]
MNFNTLFLVLLLLVTLTKLWLSRRQLNHVWIHQNKVPNAFSASISLEQHQKAANYTVAKVKMTMISTVIESIWLYCLIEEGLLSLWNNWLINHFQSPLLSGMLLIGGVSLMGAIIDLPLTLYSTFIIEQRFGFNRMTPQMYVIDLFKNTLLGMVLGIPIILAALWMMASLGSYWWLYAWCAWMLFNTLLLAIYPTWIAPLFNRFSPLPEGELRKKVEQLIKTCGFNASGLFVMDGSKRSSHGNAYFTGFGKAKRVVFFDTLLESLDTDEILAVLAHELGHYRLRHVIYRLISIFILSLAFLALLGWFYTSNWFYVGLGHQIPSNAMALTLFMLVIPIIGFPLQPLMSLFSRKHEFEADAYASRYAKADSLISALVKLYKENAATLTPDPLHSAIYDSHPPAAIRIAHLDRLARHPA